MIRCPGCDTVNADDSVVCTSCGTAIPLACGRCGAGNPPLARFCCGCGTRLEIAADTEAPSSLASPERRQMTVLFCDVVGSTALARRLDPEDWHRVLQRVHAQCADIIARHHGHVAQYLGDGLLAYFGYPVSADDAARRAVAAGLELSHEAAKIEVGAAEGLSVRVGIHTGAVIVSNVGSRRHQESLAIGETPSLAARIQEVVPAGAVVISQDTHHLVHGFFVCDEIGTYQLKGFDEPRMLYRAVAERGATTRLEAALAGRLTPLVGRNPEMDTLNRAWTSVLAGHSETVLLQGEAGIGKSRLVHSLKERLSDSGATVLELRCSEYARSSAFHPAIECLQRLSELKHDDPPGHIRDRLTTLFAPLGISERHVAVVASLLGAPLAPAETGPAQKVRSELLEALSAWLTKTDSGPRLVIVEDLHWADPSTLELLGKFVGPSASGATLALLSARPEFSPPWPTAGITSLTLGRLSTDETRELVSHVAGGKTLPADVTHRIFARAEGIPLFLEEMTKAVIESGFLKETIAGYMLSGPVRDSAIPATLQDSLMGRLDQLGHGKPIAQLAALLGKEFSYALFEATWRSIPSAPQINLAEGLERVVGAQLLTRSGERPVAIYQFKHSLLQEAAYESLLRSARREYHAHAANVLVEQFPSRAELEPELVAHHYTHADKPRQAADFWGRAGQRAIASSAYVEAIAHFSSGLEQLKVLPGSAERSLVEIDLCSRLGVAFITTRGFASADVERTYTRASELCGELGREIPLRVLYGTWAVNLVRGDLAATNRMVPIFERFAESGEDAASKLVAHAALGTWAFWRGDYARSVVHCKAAIALRDGERPKEQHAALLDQHGFEGLLYPDCYLSWAQSLMGAPNDAIATLQAAETVADVIGDPYVKVGLYAFGAQMYREIARFEQGADLSARVIELGKGGGFTLWLAAGTVINGSCKVALGSRDEGIGSIQDGMKLYQMIGAKTPYAHYLRYLADAYLERGDVELSIQAAQEGLNMARANLDQNFEGELLRLLGEAELLRGDSRAAENCFEQSLALSRSQGARLLELKAATSLARMVIRAGQKPRAAALLREVRGGFGTADELQALRNADEVLAEL
jgi:class 3 adenylate cyclase/tetratricopeptide (TPR) repeat protein